MKYRRTYPRDRIQVKEDCAKLGIDYDGQEPLFGFVAVGEDDRLCGASYTHKALIIDPFYCTEPIAALKLFYETIGAASVLDYSKIIVQVNKDNSRLISELKRLGFEKVESKFAFYKKVI